MAPAKSRIQSSAHLQPSLILTLCHVRPFVLVVSCSFLQKNTSVYVAGLPDDTDADEVAGVFSKCGIIKLDDAGQPRIKLYRWD